LFSSAGEDRLVQYGDTDHVVSEENTYGGTTRMFNRVLSRLGIEFSYVDASDAEGAEERL